MPRARNITCWKCCPIPPAHCTWATCATTRSATPWRATSGMCGFNVLHPMGWDAFGLPAENAAIKNGTPPREWTNANIAADVSRVLRAFRLQLRLAAAKFPLASRNTTAGTSGSSCACWKRESLTARSSRVNWCPECATVLANEQVIDGFCWRHETTPVEVKELEQWFLRITQYSDALLDDMARTRRRLARARAGPCSATGSENRTARACDFDVAQMDGLALEVFTTRVDTIYGVSRAVCSRADHPSLRDVCLKACRARRRWKRSSRPCGRKACAPRISPPPKKKGFSPGDSP